MTGTYKGLTVGGDGLLLRNSIEVEDDGPIPLGGVRPVWSVRIEGHCEVILNAIDNLTVNELKPGDRIECEGTPVAKITATRRG